eukprot:365095-Chlamydomonas_euryale.AAC.2
MSDHAHTAPPQPPRPSLTRHRTTPTRGCGPRARLFCRAPRSSTRTAPGSRASCARTACVKRMGCHT